MSKSEEKYLRPEQVCKMLKVSNRTLQNWDQAGQIKCIRTKGGHRRYPESDVVSKMPIETRPDIRRKICYCRVSTPSQKEDLDRQVEFFRNRYPNHEIIKDIGSGLNFKRKGFNSILESGLQGDISEIVVTHKDRLCRFSFELVQRIIENHSKGTIVVLDQEKTSPDKELVNDLISIITVFSSRLYGLRSHKLKKEIKEQATKTVENSDFSNVPSNRRTREIESIDGTV